MYKNFDEYCDDLKIEAQKDEHREAYFMKEQILKRLADAIVDCDSDQARNVAQEALDAGVSALEAIEKGASKGLEVISAKFSSGEAFLPELILAGDAMQEVMKVLSKALAEEKADTPVLGRVVIGTVFGDVHDIGKSIVAGLLSVNGFEVYDIGINVEVKEFLVKAKEVGANIIAASTLLTTSMPYQDDLAKYLVDAGVRDQYYYIVGGGPVTADWAATIKADGYGRTATDAVEVCKQLVRNGRKPGSFETVVLEYYQA